MPQFIDPNQFKFGEEASKLQQTDPNYITNRNASLTDLIRQTNPDYNTANQSLMNFTQGLKGRGVAENDVNDLYNTLNQQLQSKYNTSTSTSTQPQSEYEKMRDMLPGERDKYLTQQQQASQQQANKDISALQTGQTSTSGTQTGNQPDWTTIAKTQPGETGNTPTGGVANKPFSLNQLSPEAQAIYNSMNDQEKAAFNAAGLADINAQVKYLQNYKSNKDYFANQQNITKQQQALETQNQQISTSQAIDNARRSVDNLKQNIAFLGNFGQPGVSSQKLSAINDEVNRAEKLYNDIITTESNRQMMQQLGYQSQALAYDKQIQDMTKALNDNVNKEIQNALNQVGAADLQGMLDSPDKMQQFSQKLFNDLDHSIAGIGDHAYNQMKMLSDQYSKIATFQKDYAANAGVPDEERSKIAGYYVDKNGNKIYGEDGSPIKVPPTSVYSAYDQNTGKFINISMGPDGKPVASITNVMDQPTVTQQIIDSYAQNIVDGKLSIGNVPQNVQNMPAFQKALQNATKTTPTVKSIANSWDLGNHIYIQYEDGSHEIIAKDKDTNPEDKITNLGGGILYNDTQHRVEFDANAYLTGQPTGTITGTTTAGQQNIPTTGFTKNINLIRTGTNVAVDTNNPGNITYTTDDAAKRIGATGTYTSPNGRTYLVFPDVQTGTNALINDIEAKMSGATRTGLGPNSTLGEFIKTYTGSAGNINNSYGQAIYQTTGANKNTPLYQINSQQLAQGVMKGEGFTQGQQIMQPSAQTTTIQYTPSQTNLMELFKGKALTAAQEKQLRQQGLTTTDYSNYWASKNGVDMNKVNAIVEGRMSIKDATKGMSSGPLYEAYSSAVLDKDPNFDQGRYDFYQGWTKGDKTTSDRYNLNAFNTAIEHIGSMYNSFNELNNSNYPWWNYIKNPTSKAIGNTNIQKALATFNTEKNAAMTEISKAVKGGQLNESDVRDFKDTINSNSTPAEIQGVVKGVLDLMLGKMNTLREKYENKMGGKQPTDLFTNDAYNKLVNMQSTLGTEWNTTDFAQNAPEGNSSNVDKDPLGLFK